MLFVITPTLALRSDSNNQYWPAYWCSWWGMRAVRYTRHARLLPSGVIKSSSFGHTCNQQHIAAGPVMLAHTASGAAYSSVLTR